MQINCSSVRQWELALNGSVEFDADIVGPGVVSSFIAAALTALLTLIAAFMTYSIPRELINDVDEVISGALRTVLTSTCRVLHIAKVAQIGGDEAHKDRLRAFQTFMISISDQVLASEMAILIATFARYPDIILYSVNVVVALGCLASTVHLALMPLLVQQMREHHVIKASRSLSMVVAAILLVILLVLQLSDSWRYGEHVYFRCALGDFGIDKDNVRDDWFSFLIQLLVPVFIIYSNYEVIRLLYSRNNDSANPGGAEETLDANSRMAETQQKSHRFPRIKKGYVEMRKHSQQSSIRTQWARHEAREGIQKKMSLRKQRFRALMIAEAWTFYECQDSFLWRILWLLSGNVYGIADVVSTRSNTFGISGDRDSMGYGQIVPLVLLVLPVFAALQSTYDYRDRIKLLKARNKTTTSDLPNVSESPVETTVPFESLSGSGRVDSWTSSGPSRSSSITTATQSHPTSMVPRKRCSALSALTSTSGEDVIPTIFSPPTLDRLDTNGQPLPVGVDRSLLQWAGQSNNGEMPFLRAFVYVNTVFMLAFAVLFGWGMANGPAVLIAVLYVLLALILFRRLYGLITFWIFSRRLKEKDSHRKDAANKPAANHGQRMMHAQAASEVAADDEET